MVGPVCDWDRGVEFRTPSAMAKAIVVMVAETVHNTTHDQSIKGGHYISACTSTRDRGQDLDPANFYA